MQKIKIYLGNKKSIVLLCLILAVTAVAFLPTLKNNFTNWDDQKNIVNNPLLRQLSLSNLGKIFTSFYNGLYTPLVLLSFAIEYHFFGLDAFIYHFTNLILHLLNCALVFYLVLELSESKPVAFLTSLLFGIHPLHVESVAWVSERKDVLCALFFLTALICYMRHSGRAGKKYYIFSLGAFFLSLLTKPAGITFPFVLIAVDYLKQRKTSRRLWLEKIPFLLLALLFGLLYFFVSPRFYKQPLCDTIGNFGIYPFLTSGYAIIFYLQKILLPVRLSCLYPFPLDFAHWAKSAVFYVPAALILMGMVAYFSLRYTRKLAFGILFFLITTFPTLHIARIGKAIAADRYTYISAIGVFYIFSELFFWVYYKKLKTSLGKNILGLFLIIIIGVIVLQTHSRVRVWRDSISLWSNVIINYPHAWVAYLNRGCAYTCKKNFSRAISDYNKAIELCPDFPPAYNNRAIIYAYNNRAITYYLMHNYASSWRDVEMLGSLGYSIDPGFMAALNKVSPRK